MTTKTQQTNKVILTIGGRDEVLDQEALGVNMESSEREVLAAVQGVIQENLADTDGNYSFTVRKAINSQNIYCYPKPTAGISR